MTQSKLCSPWFWAPLWCVLTSCCHLYGDDDQWNSSLGGDWSDPDNWRSAALASEVPNGVGETAVFGPSLPDQNATVNLDIALILGALEVTTSSDVTISGTNPLTFDQTDLNGPASILLGGGSGNLNIDVQTFFNDDMALNIVDPTSSLFFARSLGATSKNMTKNGAGDVVFAGSNLGWTGTLTINDGRAVFDRGTAALDGSTNSKIVLNGGTLETNGVLHGGTITLVDGSLTTTSSSTTVIGQIIANAGNTATIGAATNATLNLQGGSTGLGGLRFASEGLVLVRGTVAHQGAITIDSGLIVVESAVAHGGGTTINGGILAVQEGGSFVNTGNIVVNAGGGLFVAKTAGSDATNNSVGLNSVVLNGGAFAVGNNLDFAPFLNAATTDGVIGLRNVSNYDVGGAGVLDFGSLPGGENLSLAGFDGSSSISAAVDLIPDSVTNTLRFGGGIGVLSPLARLEVDAQIRDFGGVATHLEHRISGETRLTTDNTYSGDTIITGGTLMVLHPNALGTTDRGTVVESGGTLSLGASTAEQVTLNGGTLSGSRVTLLSPLQISAGSSIVASFRTFEIAETISGSGPLSLSAVQSGTRLSINGDNDYTGETIVSGTAGSRVIALTPSALGDTAAGTTVVSGLLELASPTAEPLRLEGTGEAFVAAGYTGDVTLAGGTLTPFSDTVFTRPIVVESPGGALGGRDVTYATEVTGTGNVTIARDSRTTFDSPLNHDGSLTVLGGAVLNTANGYTGKTFVAGGDVIVNHAQAFGTASSAITIDDRGGSTDPGGGVTLNETVSRDFEIRNGSLTVNNTYAGTVTLREETFGGNAEIRGAGILTGEVRVLGQGINIIRGGTFQGTISGDGPLRIVAGSITGLGDEVNLDSGNFYTGLTQISSGVVNVNDVFSLGSATTGTIVRGGQLNINAASNELLLLDGSGEINLNAPQSLLPLTTSNSDGRININQDITFDESVDVWNRLNVNANVVINNLSLRAPQSEVVVADGSALSVSDGEIEIVEGDLRGQVTGPGTIVKRGTFVSEVENLGAFSGNIAVDRGRLRLLRDADDAVASVHVGSTKHAAIELVDGQVYRDAIDLNNASGPLFSGALVVGSGSQNIVELQGPIHLGDQGAIISASTNGSKQLRLAGQVTGGDLVKRGESFNLELTNADNSYTGVTDVREGTLAVTGAGRISSSSAILIGDQGRLSLRNEPGSTHDNRIDDDIPIISRGGEITLSNSDSSLQSEVLGTLTLESGHTQVESFLGRVGDANSRLEFGLLARNAGTTVGFTSATNAPIFLGQAPVLDDGIIGGFAISTVRDLDVTGFATYGPNGIQALSQFQTDINAAGPTDNVRLDNTATLLASTNINSLQGSVDLGGFELNVESGGVIGAATNGRLTAGGNADAELFLFNNNSNSGVVSADIVDNAGGGSVSLVVFGSRAFLSGNNSYSGSTTVAGTDLTLITENAMPEGGDLTIAGGNLIINYAPSSPRSIDHLLITGGGELGPRSLQAKGAFSFNSAELQSGWINRVGLHGTGEIVKTTDGTFSIDGSNPDFDGFVRVENGVLNVFRSNGLGTAGIQVNGGIFGNFSNQEAFTNSIELSGGALSVSGDSYDGPISVSRTSELLGAGTIGGDISGNGDLVVESSSRSVPISLTGDNSGYAGNISINSGSLRVRRNSSLGSGEVTINSGGKLYVGNDSLNNDITVNSGELSSDNNSVVATLTGRVSFNGSSYIGGDLPMELTGGIALSDATRLTKVGDGDLTFNGPIEVSGESTFVVPQGLVTMTGDLVPQTPDAVFNIIGRGFEQLDLSIFVPEGSSLTVMQYASPDGVETLSLDSGGQLVRGGGFLENGVDVRNGAAIAPGESAGILTIGGDATIGQEGRLIVELGGVDVGEQYDALHVAGDVFLAGILDVTLIDGFAPSLDDSFVILRGASVTGQFANAVDSLNVGGYQLPVHYLNDRVVLGRSLAVPEPGSSAVATLVIAGLLGRRRRDRRKPSTARA